MHVFEQIPWLSYYIKKIPYTGKRYMSLRSMATARAAERFQKGSTTKDIFYYLVCQLVHLSGMQGIYIPLCPTVEQRRRCRQGDTAARGRPCGCLACHRSRFRYHSRHARRCVFALTTPARGIQAPEGRGGSVLSTRRGLAGYEVPSEHAIFGSCYVRFLSSSFLCLHAWSVCTGLG